MTFKWHWMLALSCWKCSRSAAHSNFEVDYENLNTFEIGLLLQYLYLAPPFNPRFERFCENTVSCSGLKHDIGERWAKSESRFVAESRRTLTRLCPTSLPCGSFYVGLCCPCQTVRGVLRSQLVPWGPYIPAPLPRMSLRLFLLFSLVLRTIKIWLQPFFSTRMNCTDLLSLNANYRTIYKL